MTGHKTFPGYCARGNGTRHAQWVGKRDGAAAQRGQHRTAQAQGGDASSEESEMRSSIVTGSGYLTKVKPAYPIVLDVVCIIIIHNPSYLYLAPGTFISRTYTCSY